MKTQDILAKETISLKEVSLLMRRANGGEKIDFSKFWESETVLEDPEQGIKYLLNQWKTPAGKERKNSPFGYREERILENFSHFRFMGNYDAGNRYHSYQIPLWEVISKDGDSFEYHMQGGKVNIVG